jgi:hypothetical protein
MPDNIEALKAGIARNAVSAALARAGVQNPNVAATANLGLVQVSDEGVVGSTEAAVADLRGRFPEMFAVGPRGAPPQPGASAQVPPEAMPTFTLPPRPAPSQYGGPRNKYTGHPNDHARKQQYEEAKSKFVQAHQALMRKMGGR